MVGVEPDVGEPDSVGGEVSGDEGQVRGAGVSVSRESGGMWLVECDQVAVIDAVDNGVAALEALVAGGGGIPRLVMGVQVPQNHQVSVRDIKEGVYCLPRERVSR